ncbi:MAG TPA: DUF3416 domain-containing protein, partial [Rhodopila sp.]|nr:DUF3416 domain-containing protein [Rhodopila sp.]
MSLTPSDTPPSAWSDRRGVVNVYHLHPLVAGALNGWAAEFARIAAMGFGHVCLAPPFAPGGSGEIFVHATLDRLHPALGFEGPAEQGIEQAAAMAQRAGLTLMLDIAPGRVAAESPLRQEHPAWFAAPGGGAVADPRRRPQPVGVAVPRFELAGCADTVADWWIDRLARLVRAGVGGFRCLTLDVVPAPFWRQVRAALPEALFVAWTPGVRDVRGFAGVGFDYTVSSAGWWDGRASWFFDEQAVLRDVAPALASPEPSFLERLASRLPPDADVAEGCRLALGIAAATGAGLFVPMGFEYAAARGFDTVRAGPDDMAAVRREMAADLSSDVAAAIRLGATLPPAAELRPVTSP